MQHCFPPILSAKIVTIFTFMRTQKCRVTCLQIELCNFFIHQTDDEEIFFQSARKGHCFLFKLFVDRVVHKLFRVERHDLYWEHTKWFNEDD
jgi:hypothetical protein